MLDHLVFGIRPSQKPVANRLEKR